MATLTREEMDNQPLWYWFKGSWADRLLLLLCIALIIASWQWIHASVSSGPPMAMIYHGEKLLARYPLASDGEPIHFHAEGELGVSEILIDRHGARFLSSPCTTHYCVAHGARNTHGDIVACVPNRILIAIEGSGNAHTSLDAIVE